MAYTNETNSLPLRPGGRLLLLVIFLSSVIASVAQTNDAPVEARIPHPPTLFEASDHRSHLAYELHLTNFYDGTGPLTIKRLSVFGDSSASPVATFTNEELIKLLNSEETPPAGTNVIIPPGKRNVLFLWLTFPLDVPPPGRLYHTIDFKDDSAEIHSLAGAAVHLDQKPVIELGAPVRGHNWFIDEGPGNPRSHHWGSMLAVNGVVTIPQRFAIDLIGLDDAGHAVEASPDTLNKTSNSQWIGYGSEVLAVHDGIVRGMRDGVADHAPLSPLPSVSEITAHGVYGNYVVLEIGPGVFAHYAHLQNGSIHVHIGQHVKKGEVMARLGDSGNAGAPHLHFQVTDKPTFELSEGIPFVFTAMALLGKTEEGIILGSGIKFQARATLLKNALPLDGDVLRF